MFCLQRFHGESLILDAKQRLLPMSIVIRHLCGSFVPLVTEKEVETFASYSEPEIAKVLSSKRFQLATNPKTVLFRICALLKHGVIRCWPTFILFRLRKF